MFTDFVLSSLPTLSENCFDDVILSVAGTDITSAKQFAGLVAKLDKTKQVNMLVRRGDIARYLLLKPSTK